MNRDEILDKGAAAMQAKHDPAHADTSTPWHATSLRMYRERFETGLDVTEDDIRRDERNRITAWLRECADRVEREEGDGARQGVATLRQVAQELDRRPINEGV